MQAKIVGIVLCFIETVMVSLASGEVLFYDGCSTVSSNWSTADCTLESDGETLRQQTTAVSSSATLNFGFTAPVDEMTMVFDFKVHNPGELVAAYPYSPGEGVRIVPWWRAYASFDNTGFQDIKPDTWYSIAIYNYGTYGYQAMWIAEGKQANLWNASRAYQISAWTWTGSNRAIFYAYANEWVDTRTVADWEFDNIRVNRGLDLTGKNPVSVATPVFTPDDVVISGPTLITVTTTTEGAKIYYTTDGTTPATSPTSSTFLYTGAVTVNPGNTLKAIAVKAGQENSDVTSVSYVAPLTPIDNVTWTFSNVQVQDGGSAFWVSASPISTAGTQYDYTYTITKIEASMTTLSWINVTNFFDSSYLSGSGTKESSVPFDVMNQTMAGSSGSYGASADVHVYVDAGGYLHVDVTNFDLNFLTYKYVRISGSVTATASVVQTSTSSPMLVVLPSTVNVSAGAGTTSFTVNNSGNGTMPWSAWVSEGSDWLSITSGASGSNSGTISVSFAANTVTESRIAKIQVTAAGATGSPKEITIVQAAATVVRTLGDANGDSKVDVGDLGILAANYGGTGKTWAQGDFNGDGKVDVGDLGILAANYGTGSSSASDFDADYAKVFGAADSMSSEDSADESDSSICSSLGLSLVAGLAMMGLMMVKLEE
jgi:uncharacterized protein (DUF2141 family)